MPKRPTKSKKTVRQGTIPATLTEVETIERETSDLLIEIRRIELETEVKKSAIDEIAAVELGPRRVKVIENARRVHAFAEANKTTLTENGARKSAELGTSGAVQWHTLPASVHISNNEKVIQHLRRLGLTQFIRTGPDEIDKEAMLSDKETAETVPGISIKKGEKFYLRFTSTKARVECTLDTHKWQIVWPKATDEP